MNEVRVLLVEDDEDDYVLTQSLLSEINIRRFTLEWVTTYDAALEKLAHSDYDVCLFDYRLGAHTGLELLRAARSGGYTIPMILLTGQGDQEIDVEAMQAGAADYLIKGQIDASLLERSIRYALEQKRIEEERLQHIREQERRIQAESASKAKDEFLAMVSHELRTPLNAVIGWTQVLRAGKQDVETVERAVEAIERSARLQAQFVEDLLDVARIVSGNLRLETQTVKLGPIIESVINSVRPSADAKHINLTLNIASAGEIEVEGDPSRLQQVVGNLLSNAVKFTPDEGNISVNLTREDQKAVITVSDSGQGISKEFLPYVFDRYRQAEDASPKRYGGLGLGLAIAHYLVECHHGTISAASPGENLGAVFTVTLPVI